MKHKHKTRIPRDIKKVQKYMEDKVGVNHSVDAGMREIKIFGKTIQLYYINGLVDSSLIVEVLKMLVQINDDELPTSNIEPLVRNRIVHEQVDEVNIMEDAVDQLLSGLVPVFIDGCPLSLIIDLREYPSRGPEEPDSERVIRGSRDGYTENIVINTALTRRRIRDPRLRNEVIQVGKRSKTDVIVSYIDDIADDDLVQTIKEKICEIDIDGIAMADKAIDEFILDRKWNIYPLVRYTERPDVAAHHLLEGHILIMADTSPSIIILPTTFFHHLQHAEESRQSPLVGTFVRWIRFFAVFLSIYLLPIWLLFSNEPSLLPKELAFIGPEEEGNISLVFQIIIADIGVEFLRMAAIHTPTPLSTALGLIAAVLVGEIAVEVGLFSPEVILYVAVSVIGSYVTPSYELSVSNKLTKLFLIILTSLFGIKGLMIGIVINIIYMVKTRALNTPYLWPFIPFDAHAMLRILIRLPIPFANVRPSITHPKNAYRQPRRNKS